MFFSNACWLPLLAPLEILMSKISLKYIPIHIFFFLAQQGDYEHEIPISTIRAIIKKFQSTKDAINLPGR